MTATTLVTAAAPPDRLRLSQRERLLILGFWVVFGLLETTGAYVTTRLADAPMPLSTALVANMPWWLVWAALTPVMFWIASRIRFEEGRWPAFAAAHFGVALLLSITHILIAGAIFFYGTRDYYMAAYPRMEFTLDGLYKRWAQTYLIIDFIVYWAIVGGYHALEYNRRFRREQVDAARLQAKAAQLEARVTEARLAALRMELNPHFLFNTLNAISGLIRRGEHPAAVTMLARLGDLLRATLERGGEQTVPLEKELEYLDRYLEIERVRFHDRLVIRNDIDDDARHALVPTMILQPLIENAVRHGISRRPGAGAIDVRAHREDGELRLTVADTGIGFPEGPTRIGVGMKNTRARLDQLFGERASLTWTNRDEGGAEVSIRMPFVTERETVETDGPAGEPAAPAIAPEQFGAPAIARVAAGSGRQT